MVEIHVTVDFHLLMLGWDASFVLVEEGFGLWNIDVIVEMKVAQSWHPGAVWGLVLTHEHERLTQFLGFLDAVDGHVSDDVGAVAIDDLTAFWGKHSGIVVIALTWKDGPGVEALGFSLEVRFTVKGGMVTSGTENFWKNLLVPVEGIPVVHEAIFMAVLSAHNDGARGTANGVSAEGILKKHAVVGELVDFGGWIY